MPKKVSVTIPDAVYNDISTWANEQGRTIANLAAKLLEDRVDEVRQEKKAEYKPENR